MSKWTQCRRLVEAIFGEEVTTVSHKYTGLVNHVEHINQFQTTFAEYPRQEWVHHFIHTLEMTPRRWYTSMELRQGTKYWEGLIKQFAHTFEFANEQPTVDAMLQKIMEKIFAEIPVEEASSHQCNTTIQQWMACYNLAGDPNDDSTNINIPK